MSFGKKTGIGPAMRVLRHFIERRRFYQLKFASGEQALVLIAGMPAPSVELVSLALGGLVPWQTVWEYNPIRAGGYSDYIHKLTAMFSPPTGRSDDSVHYIRDALLSCRSIEEARTLLFDRERSANNDTGEVNGGFPKYKPTSFADNDDWRLESEAPASVSAPERPRSSAIPNRYRISGDDRARVLTCIEAPMVMVRAKRGIVIPAKQARKYPAGTIFLDGAAQGEPFADVHKDIYNLDHPEGCIQSMATCEQAMVLIRKGVDLRKRDWEVWANDSDLDTIFAVWVLLNHLRLNDDAEVRAKVMPLLRLEGAIDAHGPESQYLAALPPDTLRLTAAIRKQLQQQEFVLKSYGRWMEFDLLEYIADRLRAIDEVIYEPDNFAGLLEVDELARAEITNGSVAVVCSTDASMDEVERQLQRTYGERLGVLIFQHAASNYRVRQVDRNLPAMLGQAYERLNLVDPAATSGAENRWGGSTEVGYSPGKTGTSLTPAQIIAAVREAFWAPRFFDVVAALPRALFIGAAGLAPALGLIFVGNLARDRAYIAGDTVLLSALVLAVTVAILFYSKARAVPGLYGWRIPTGFAWVSALPAALIGGAIGGAWAPGSLAHRLGADGAYQFTGAAALLLPLAAELLFRGVILGHLAARLPMQKNAGPWWNSWPTLISTALYTAASLLLFVTISRGQILFSQWILIVGGAAILGVASGVARERSESILASVLLHWVCAAALLLCSRLRF
jgi:membrane protease YdiL (CAAX protease family)